MRPMIDLQIGQLPPICLLKCPFAKLNLGCFNSQAKLWLLAKLWVLATLGILLYNYYIMYSQSHISHIYLYPEKQYQPNR